jgi:hypothetical protein
VSPIFYSTYFYVRSSDAFSGPNRRQSAQRPALHRPHLRGRQSQVVEAKIFLTYQRQLNNLSIQEGRLRRQREKDTTALRELQEQRRRKRQARLDEAARDYIQAVHEDRQDDFDDPSKLGFEFSLAEIEVRAIDLKPDLFADWDPNADEEAA